MNVPTWLVVSAGMPAAPWGELLHRFWPVAGAAFGVSLIATPVCRHLAWKWGIVDRPDTFLKPHARSIPYLGGVAIFLGWAAGVGIALMWADSRLQLGRMAGILVAGSAIMLIGLFDDLRAMSPRVKLAANIAVAFFILALGLGDELVRVAVGFAGLTFAPHERWLELAYSVPVMLLIVVGACNATNLIDGLDGLCSGVLGIISVGFLILAMHLRAYGDSPEANERIILASAMLGAAAGFLPFNLNPATVFMGDAGSMLLGLNAAVIMLLFAEENLLRWMLGVLMVFGLPIGDMLLTLARRWRNGRPVMQGDRSHFYDQLVDRGLTVRQVVAISYLLSLAFAVVGTSVIFLRTRHVILVYFAVVLMALAAIWRFDMAGIEAERPGRDAGGHKV